MRIKITYQNLKRNLKEVKEELNEVIIETKELKVVDERAKLSNVSQEFIEKGKRFEQNLINLTREIKLKTNNLAKLTTKIK